MSDMSRGLTEALANRIAAAFMIDLARELGEETEPGYHYRRLAAALRGEPRPPRLSLRCAGGQREDAARAASEESLTTVDELFDFLRLVPGLGPKRAQMIVREVGLTIIGMTYEERLVYLKALPNIGPFLARTVAEVLPQAKEREKDMARPEPDAEAESVRRVARLMLEEAALLGPRSAVSREFEKGAEWMLATFIEAGPR